MRVNDLQLMFYDKVFFFFFLTFSLLRILLDLEIFYILTPQSWPDQKIRQMYMDVMGLPVKVADHLTKQQSEHNS